MSRMSQRREYDHFDLHDVKNLYSSAALRYVGKMSEETRGRERETAHNDVAVRFRFFLPYDDIYERKEKSNVKVKQTLFLRDAMKKTKAKKKKRGRV